MTYQGRETWGFLGRTDAGERVHVRLGLHWHPEQRTTRHHTTVDGVWRVSVSGHWFRPRSRGGDIDGGGQCIGEAAAVTTLAPGWTRDDHESLLHMWRRWHLNDMSAGCAHQTPVYTPSGAPDLDATAACPITGYRFGTAWLVTSVPVGVRDEITRLLSLLDGDTGLR